MTEEELISAAIDNYVDFQRITAAKTRSLTI